MSKTVEFLAPYSLINNDKAHSEFSKEALLLFPWQDIFMHYRIRCKLVWHAKVTSDTWKDDPVTFRSDKWALPLAQGVPVWHLSLQPAQDKNQKGNEHNCYSHSAFKRGSILNQQNLGFFALRYRVRKLGDFQERWDFHLIKIIWKSKAWSSQKSLIKFCFKRSTAMVKCCSP